MTKHGKGIATAMVMLEFSTERFPHQRQCTCDFVTECFYFHIIPSFHVFLQFRPYNSSIYLFLRYCSKCKQHQKIAKKISLWTLPPILVILLTLMNIALSVLLFLNISCDNS